MLTNHTLGGLVLPALRRDVPERRCRTFFFYITDKIRQTCVMFHLISHSLVPFSIIYTVFALIVVVNIYIECDSPSLSTEYIILLDTFFLSSKEYKYICSSAKAKSLKVQSCKINLHKFF